MVWRVGWYGWYVAWKRVRGMEGGRYGGWEIRQSRGGVGSRPRVARYLKALHFDELLHPVHNVPHASLVDEADVAGQVEAVFVEALSRRAWAVEVPLHHVGASEADLARALRAHAAEDLARTSVLRHGTFMSGLVGTSRKTTVVGRSAAAQRCESVSSARATLSTRSAMY